MRAIHVAPLPPLLPLQLARLARRQRSLPPSASHDLGYIEPLPAPAPASYKSGALDGDTSQIDHKASGTYAHGSIVQYPLVQVKGHFPLPNFMLARRPGMLGKRDRVEQVLAIVVARAWALNPDAETKLCCSSEDSHPMPWPVGQPMSIWPHLMCQPFTPASGGFSQNGSARTRRFRAIG